MVARSKGGKKKAPPQFTGPLADFWISGQKLVAPAVRQFEGEQVVEEGEVNQNSPGLTHHWKATTCKCTDGMERRWAKPGERCCKKCFPPPPPWVDAEAPLEVAVARDWVKTVDHCPHPDERTVKPYLTNPIVAQAFRELAILSAPYDLKEIERIWEPAKDLPRYLELPSMNTLQETTTPGKTSSAPPPMKTSGDTWPVRPDSESKVAPAQDGQTGASGSRKKILISGSRQASPKMNARARKMVRRAAEIGAEIIVGDALGVDMTVIGLCDVLAVPITVFGGYGRMRHRTLTGNNVALDGDYLARDRYMVELCGENDVIVCIWNGASTGTKYVHDYAISKGRKPLLELFPLEEVTA